MEAMAWASLSMGWTWVAMGCAGREPDKVSADHMSAMGWVGLVMVRSWVGRAGHFPAMGLAGHCPAMCWAGNWLVCPWAGPAMFWAGHGRPWGGLVRAKC